MPVHDWTRVDAGIFHAFHVGWISAISQALNTHVLPPSYYALPERRATSFKLNCLTPEDDAIALAPIEESDMSHYCRKQTRVVVRGAADDRVVAVVDIASPANKSGRAAMRSFVEKAAEVLRKRVHLLIIDLLPYGPHDPQGIHAVLWDHLAIQSHAPPGKPLTLAAYETASAVRAYVRRVGVGDVLGEMPLFLEPNTSVEVPLEKTYLTSFAAMPSRWRRVLDESC